MDDFQTEYTLADGEFYKVLNKNTGAYITCGQLIPDQILSTIHTVVFITEQEYNELVEAE
jgi:hypothetical protein